MASAINTSVYQRVLFQLRHHLVLVLASVLRSEHLSKVLHTLSLSGQWTCARKEDISPPTARRQNSNRSALSRVARSCDRIHGPIAIAGAHARFMRRGARSESFRRFLSPTTSSLFIVCVCSTHLVRTGPVFQYARVSRQGR